MAGETSQCSQIQFGDGIATAPVTNTAVVVANGVATITAAAHGLVKGDVVEITGTDGIARLNSFHLVDFVDATTFTIENGNFQGTIVGGSEGTTTKLNTTWGNLASATGWSVEITNNENEVTDLDVCDGTVESVISTTQSTATFDLNYRPTQASHYVISGLHYMITAKTNFWWRILYKGVNELDPPMNAFLAVMTSLSETGAVGESMTLSAGFSLNSPKLVLS